MRVPVPLVRRMVRSIPADTGPGLELMSCYCLDLLGFYRSCSTVVPMEMHDLGNILSLAVPGFCRQR